MRTQIVINNANISVMRRIEAAISKDIESTSYTIKLYEKTIIVNDNSFLDNIERIIKSVDESLTLSITDVKEKYRYVFYLENLDCANCAAKVERLCKRRIQCEMVVVDFATLKIIIETSKKYDTFDIRMLIQECAESVDPHIEVKEKLSKKEEKDSSKNSVRRILFFVGIGMFLVAEIIKDILKFGYHYEGTFLYIFVYATFIPAYLLIGYDVLYGALKNIKSGRIFDEKFLISLATITAFTILLYDEAVLLMAFYQLGEMIQSIIVNKSRKNLTELVREKIEKVVIDVDGAKQEITPDGVMIDDIIYVSGGQKVVLDGVVTDGEATLDCKSLTGESIPVSVKSGDKVLSGSVCIDGNIKLRVTKTYEESTVKVILNMVENANINKSRSEKVITKFARFYTPVICIIAIILGATLPLFMPNGVLSEVKTYGYQDSIRTAMIFLVASCPCALVISIPLAYFGAIGISSKNGTLVKGSNYLESLSNVEAVVFDKTGTLTKGSFLISNVIAYSEYTKEEILYYAAHIESLSTHVIAQSVIKAYNKDINTQIVTPDAHYSSKGISGMVGDKHVKVGNKDYLQSHKIKLNEEVLDDHVLYVIIENKLVGYLVIEDEVRKESIELIDKLKKRGIKRLVMLTGDSFNVAEKVAKEIGITEFYYNMLPMDKVEKLKKIKEECTKGKVVFVGDGINDAPVISESDVGIAISGIDNSAVTQIADIVLVNNDLNKVDDVIKISKQAKMIIIENIIITLFIKFTVMILSMFKGEYLYNTAVVYLSMFADVGVSIIAVLNTLRLLRRNKQ